VDAHLDVGGKVVEPARVDVDRHDAAGGPDSLRQPRGHRGSSGADLPAAACRADAEGVEVAERDRVEGRGQRGEALTGLRGGVVQ